MNTLKSNDEIEYNVREDIHNIGVEIATLAVREYVGEAENYIEEFHNLINRIMKYIEEEYRG